MTNRQRLDRTNMYDILVKINDNIQNYVADNAQCVLDLIEPKKSHVCKGKNCDECIQKWLNEEETRWKDVKIVINTRKNL